MRVREIFRFFQHYFYSSLTQGITEITDDARQQCFFEIRKCLTKYIMDESLKLYLSLSKNLTVGSQTLLFALSFEDGVNQSQIIFTHSFLIQKPKAIPLDLLKCYIELHIRRTRKEVRKKGIYSNIQHLPLYSFKSKEPSPASSQQLPLFFQNMATDEKLQECQSNKQNQLKMTNLLKLAEEFNFIGEYKRAIEIYKELLKEHEIIWGPSDQRILAIKCRLADVLSNQGNYTNAIDLYTKVLTETEKLLGPHHRDTLTIKNNMAIALANQGMSYEALKIRFDYFKKEKNSLDFDPGHSLNLIVKHNTASLFQNQGKSNEAMAINQEMLPMLNKIFGPCHPITLATKHNIAILLDLDTDENCNKALKMLSEILDMETTVMGPNHPNTLITKHNIAFVLESQGKFAEALELYEEVLKWEEELLGLRHPNCLATKSNIASVLVALGDFQIRRAIQIYLEVLEDQKELLGPSHPETLVTLNNIGWCYFKRGEYTKSASVADAVMTARETVLGPGHPDYENTKKLFAKSVQFFYDA